METTIQDIVYHYVCLASGVVCVLLAFFLLDIRSYKKKIKKQCPVLFPRRYIYARLSLGIAYVVLGVLTALQVLLDLPDETTMFLPILGLIIASSQALLFTMALLSFYNSRLANYKLVWGSILPLLLLLVMHQICSGNSDCQREIRIMWLVVYIFQLIVFSFTFFRARRDYAKALDRNIGNTLLRSKYAQKGLLPLFIGTLLIGTYALVSFFFTEKTSLSVFIMVYTLYYAAVRLYALRYAEMGLSVVDISQVDE